MIRFLQTKFSEDLWKFRSADVRLLNLEAVVGHSLMNKESKENRRTDGS